MALSSTIQMQRVLTLANEAARGFNHGYVGTEHILIGLIEEGFTDISKVLAAFGIDADKVRSEIEKLVQRGRETVTRRSLPLTPRAENAIEHAHIEARLMNEKCIRPEHLFLGLMNDPSSVARQVLVHLGIRPAELTKEVFRVPVTQMTLVERIVRPVRASTRRKRKIRDELLMHVGAIYDQELLRLNDPAAALSEMAARFGDPTELACELEAALPYHERISNFIENLFAWRARESAAQYALRQAKLTFYSVAGSLLFIFALVFTRYGRFDNLWTLARVFAAIAILASPAQFAITIAWIKMRDAMWGKFGSHKSYARVLGCDAIVAIVTMLSLTALTCISRWSFETGFEPIAFAAVGAIAAAISLVAVWLSGPETIRDTFRKMLNIEVA